MPKPSWKRIAELAKERIDKMDVELALSRRDYVLLSKDFVEVARENLELKRMLHDDL
jgi:hypothetical protein